MLENKMETGLYYMASLFTTYITECALIINTARATFDASTLKK